MAIIYGAGVKELCAKIAERLIASLEAGVAPWVCPYDRHNGLPFNVFRRVRAGHKKPYTGINRVLLELWMWENAWMSPAFMTMTQLRELNPGKDPDGPRIKRVDGGIPLSPDDWRTHGQEPCSVVVFKPKVKKKPDGEEESNYFGRVYSVFNVAQLTNLPPDIAEAAQVSTAPFKPECVPAEILTMIEELRLVGGVTTSQIPCYRPALDQIGMPPRKAFSDNDAYLAVLLHEAGRAAGNAGRVGREPRGEKRNERIVQYAREELCAEMTSAMSMAAFGLPQTRELQHAAYLNHYIEVLKADPAILVWAASQAEKRTAFLVEKAKLRTELVVAAKVAAHA